MNLDLVAAGRLPGLLACVSGLLLPHRYTQPKYTAGGPVISPEESC
jgi:hypothetical protein